MTLRLPSVYAITDRASSGLEDHVEIAGRLLAVGVRCVQLREKTLPDRELLAAADALGALARPLRRPGPRQRPRGRRPALRALRPPGRGGPAGLRGPRPAPRGRADRRLHARCRRGATGSGRPERGLRRLRADLRQPDEDAPAGPRPRRPRGGSGRAGEAARGDRRDHDRPARRGLGRRRGLRRDDRRPSRRGPDRGERPRRARSGPAAAAPRADLRRRVHGERQDDGGAPARGAAGAALRRPRRGDRARRRAHDPGALRGVRGSRRSANGSRPFSPGPSPFPPRSSRRAAAASRRRATAGRSRASGPRCCST